MSRLFTALLLALVAAVAWLLSGGTAWLHNAARRVIRRRLHNYKVRLNRPDTLLPEAVPTPTKVAVIGGGLAGIAAASTLAERGCEVVLYEANDHLGGKLGAWRVDLGEHGGEQGMEHGFHAFFGSYYNLDRFLSRLGLDGAFRTTEDYRILTRDGRSLGFAGLEPTPFLNLLDLVRKGVLDGWSMLLNPRLRRLDPLLRYDPEVTFARLDHVSFEQFSREAALPADMRLMFNTFARAFFARADQMSMAALMKSFHLYYLSNDAGLMFRYPTDDHGTALLAPMRAWLEKHGVSVRLSSPVERLERQKNGRLRVNGQPYDHVVLATDVGAAGRILASSPLAEEDPALIARLTRLRPQNRYSVLRVWIDKDPRPLPAFTVTEKIRILDSVTTVHRAEAEAGRWVAARGGGAVLELHAYEVPEKFTSAEAIREALLADLDDHLPELRGASILHEEMYVKDDFTPFFTGMEAHRPPTTTAIEGLVVAGDWVKLPCPAMLMEGAFTSGLLAANTILTASGAREEVVYSVPLRGALGAGA